MFTATIPLMPPYSFDRLLRRLQTHPDEQLHVDANTGEVRRALRIDEKPVLVRLQFSGETEAPLLTLSTSAILTAKQQQKVTERVSHMFSAHVDLLPMLDMMEADEHLRLLGRHFRGLRYLLAPDLFQAMVTNIIAQQLNLPFANRLTLRLLQHAGDSVTDEEGRSYLVFPSPEAIARLDPTDLRPLQFSQRKAEYIIDFARAVVDGQINLRELEELPDEEVISSLTRLRGIGRWTVECLLMFGLGRPDLLPAADIGLRNGIQLVYGLTDKPDEKEIRRIGESWAPWRSYVSLYMWEAVGAARRGEEPFAGIYKGKASK